MNHPLVFAVESNTKTVTSRTMHLETGDKYSVIQNSVETRYQLKLTPVRKAHDGTWTLHYEPMDRQEIMDVIDDDGHVSTTIHNLDIRSTRDDKVEVDTAAGVGYTQGKTLKEGVYPKLLSGFFDFKPDGEISKVDGDLPFIDFWTDTIKYQVGFFDFIFPPNPVSRGDSWNANITLKDLQGTIRLEGDGILETNIFKRDEHAATAGPHILAYAGSLLAHETGLMGDMDLMGEETKVKITDFNHTKNGKYQYDPDAGCLSDGSQDENVTVTVELAYKGNPVTMKTELHITSKFQLMRD